MIHFPHRLYTGFGSEFCVFLCLSDFRQVGTHPVERENKINWRPKQVQEIHLVVQIGSGDLSAALGKGVSIPVPVPNWSKLGKHWERIGKVQIQLGNLTYNVLLILIPFPWVCLSFLSCLQGFPGPFGPLLGACWYLGIV